MTVSPLWGAAFAAGIAFTGVLGVTAPSRASEPVAAGSPLSIELNKLAGTREGCQLSFVARNDTSQAISAARFEFAFFDRDGLLERLTALNFRDLPTARTKVRQFVLPKVQCETLGRIVINDAVACEGISPDACYRALTITNRTNVEFGL